jgi:hypothetical protein
MVRMSRGPPGLAKELEKRIQTLETALEERLALLDDQARARLAAPLVVEAGRALRSGRYAAAHDFLERARYTMERRVPRGEYEE